MAFALLIIGAVLITTAVLDTVTELVNLLKLDFTGPNNFVYWVVALLLIGAVGYVPKLKPVSDGLLVMVILVLFLSKGNPSGIGGGFFQQFTSALGTTGNASSLAASSIGNTLGGVL